MKILDAQFYHNPLRIPATTKALAAKELKTISSWHALHGCSASLAIATLAQEQRRPVIVIAKDLQIAARLTREIAFFLDGASGINNNSSTSRDDSDSSASSKSSSNAANSSNASIPALNFPDWETLPYDHFSPHQDIISERLATLYRLPHLQRGILVTSINTLMQRLPPRAHIERNSFVLQCGDHLNLDDLRHRMEKQGYTCVNKVMEHGEFAVRGALIDLFPMGSAQPLRIDLFDDQVDSIRLFDVETQLTTSKIRSFNLLPAKEFPLTPDAIARFRQNWRAQFSGDPTRCTLYQSISNGESAGGIEYYLPLFFEESPATFSDYLPPSSLLVIVDDVHTSADTFWQEIRSRHNELQHDLTRPLLMPATVFLPVDEVFGQLKSFPQIHITNDSSAGTSTESGTNTDINTGNKVVRGREQQFPVTPLPNISIDNKATQPLTKLAAFIAAYSNNCAGNILFCADSRGRLETLLDILRLIGIAPHVVANWADFVATLNILNISTSVSAQQNCYITVGALEQGFALHCNSHNNGSDGSDSSVNTKCDGYIAVITEADLFGQQLVMQRRQRNSKHRRAVDPQHIVRDLIELHPNSPVVHLEHGIGRYLGLQTIRTADGVDAEFLAIEYANSAKLYVPIASLHLISRYTGSGDPENIPYNTLGTDKWGKTKHKALEKIRDVAAELLAIYAQRAARPGFAFTFQAVDYQKFAALFPFEETEDQQQAIAAVIEDMTAPRHMDRLICGDVGFGKTEVAMRATFIAVSNSKQVAILVPTTILAQQHYLNFQDRFADWPVTVELISRVRSAREQKEILAKLQDGKIDIIIGTHRLLQSNIQFKNLGLLIIDEEHRFGVKQKERLKELRPDVDLLTLTATPIPRTLNMALAGMRSFSIIATPPARRLAIKTFIHERDNSVIREAIWREILRGGQVYFLHNDVATIEKTADELLRLIPSLKIAVAHGQMREHQLEHIMSDFYHLRYNVLVCSTIIESGIDVPTANTIIIDRADRFGLAQLHQLRGRVGRSHHQAYAYLMVPSKKMLATDARRRLEAISSMEDLGAGFNLATHDLEIRGAGELLGAEQSGQIEGIGFTLYMEYLESAVEILKAGGKITLDGLNNLEATGAAARAEVEVSKLPTLFPDIYIHDVATRLTLYKRLANTKSADEIVTLKEEVIDRFGSLPPATKNLFKIAEIRLQSEKLGIKKINANASGGLIIFSSKPSVDPSKILALIQQQPNYFKLRGQDKLAFFYKSLGEKKAEGGGKNYKSIATQTIEDPVKILDYIEQIVAEFL